MLQKQKPALESARSGGKLLRPAGWIERISTQLAGLWPEHHLRHQVYVHPCMIAGMKCLLLKRSLREHHPAAYEFILKFARDNRLSVQKDRRAQTAPPLHERRKPA